MLTRAEIEERLAEQNDLVNRWAVVLGEDYEAALSTAKQLAESFEYCIKEEGICADLEGHCPSWYRAKRGDDGCKIVDWLEGRL
jgi:hypothetical protein